MTHIEQIDMGSAGFSLLELIVVMLITSLLFVAAVPQIHELFASYNRQDARQQFEFDVRRARTEALAEGALGIIQMADDNTSYTFGVDYLPFSEPPEMDTEIFTRVLPDDITIELGATIIFDSRGFVVDDLAELDTVDIILNQDEEQFCSATLYASGALDYEC